MTNKNITTGTEYELRVWRHHQIIKDINTHSIGILKTYLKFYKTLEDNDECYVEVYINSKKLTVKQCVELYKELGL